MYIGSVPNAAINELVLPTFSDSNKQVAVQFLRELENYFKLKQIPDSLKLPLTASAITCAYSKIWLSAVYHDLKDYEQFRENFANISWSKPHQSRIRCALYQDKYSRKEGESMTAHFLRYANLASNLQPPMSEDDPISALISHCSIHVQKNIIDCKLKNIQEALNYLSKMEALDSQHDFRKDRSPLDQREYNRGPRNRQATEQNDVRRRAGVQVRQVNYSGGGQSNRNGRMQGWPRAYRGRNSNDSG